jgi:FixJ family two-component response regulator
MQIERTPSSKSESAIPAIAPLARVSGNPRVSDRKANPEHGIWVLDNDVISRKPVCTFLKKAGYRTEVVDSIECLLGKRLPTSATCLVVMNPFEGGAEAPQIIEQLKHHGFCLPVVVIAYRWDLKLAVKSLKAGATNFLAAPADPDELLDAVEEALQQAQATQRQQYFIDDAVRRIASLNPREKEILALILAGLLNKEIADRLKLALVTVKVYRARVMKKLGAGNAASMACIAGLGGMDVQAGLTFIEG